MTAIVGIAHEGTIWMGADSLASESSWGWASGRTDRKIFRRDPFLVGFTSSFRMGQLLHRVADLPTPYWWEEDLHGFMVARFVPAVRACFAEHGFAKIAQNEESAGEFLVGLRGQLFRIASDYQVAQSMHGYDATGSGGQVALGSLHSTAHDGMAGNPEGRIIEALEAAERHNAYVRRPFHVIGL